MKILFLSRWFPYPADNGSKLRISNLLRALAEHHEVTLLSFADSPDLRLDDPEIQLLCSSVHVIPWKEFEPRSWQARLGLFSLKPRSIVDTFSPAMAQKISELLSEDDYDLVVASQLSMAAYRRYFGKTPALFEELEMGLSYTEAHNSVDLKKRLRYGVTWFKLRVYLSRLLHSFQACSVVSKQERGLLVQNFAHYKGIVEVIPNCVDVSGNENHQSVVVPNQLIFSGSFRYHANYEAMLWFVRDVFPKVLEKVPDANLIITGDHANLPFPSVSKVRLVGHVSDIKTLVASSWVSVAPLLSGGGTRLKILEAMSVGTPVVSTSKGAEGLDAIVGEHLFVADRADDFAEELVKILKDRDLRDRLSINGKRFVTENYSWELTAPRFLSLVEKAANS